MAAGENQGRTTATELHAMALAKYEEGLRWERGWGVCPNVSRARDCYAAAADMGCALARYRLGISLEFGLGTERDLAGARQCYAQAAEQGVAPAQVAYGRFLLEGVLGERQVTEARRQFSLAAAQGDADGSYWLGTCQECGYGGMPDLEAAVNCYRQAAEQGCAAAQSKLGRGLLYGCWGALDEEQAVAWLTAAAQQNVPEACWLLGLCLTNGWGVPQQEGKGLRWLERARDLGECRAAETLARLGYPAGGSRSDCRFRQDMEKVPMPPAVRPDEDQEAKQEVKDGTLMTGEELQPQKLTPEPQPGETNAEPEPEAEEDQGEAVPPPAVEIQETRDQKPDDVWHKTETVLTSSEWYRKGRKSLKSRNFKDAWSEFERGGQEGDSACLCAMGECCERGEGCERDEERAAAFFSQAAEAGNPRAKILLGKYEYSEPSRGRLVSEQDHFIMEELGLKMLWCPRGTFQMGSPKSWFGGTTERGRSDNELRHQVTLTTGFWMAQIPMTQEVYGKVAPALGLAANPSQFKGARLPVENVSWTEAQIWCDGLTAHQREAGRLPDHYVYRLPTEAEWEYACRAGSDAAFYDGRNLLREDGVCESLQKLGWFRDNSNELTHEVGLLAANDWEFLDMHGNVSEWCYDKVEDYEAGPCVDPLHGFGTGSTEPGLRRIRRGGSWQDTAKDCRCASRSQGSVSFRRPFIGFRLALGVELPPWRQ